MPEYSKKVQQHFRHPKNVGEIRNPDGVGKVGNPVCGDIMELYIKVKNSVIKNAKFKTFGCGAAIATSSMVTELVKGKTIEEALKISNSAVAEALGGLPPIKMHCSVLAEEALKSAIQDYLKKKKTVSRKPKRTRENATHTPQTAGKPTNTGSKKEGPPPLLN